MRISDWSSDVCSSDLVLADYPVFVCLVGLRDRHARDRQRGRAHACGNSESSFASHVPFHFLHKGRGVGRAAVTAQCAVVRVQRLYFFTPSSAARRPPATLAAASLSQKFIKTSSGAS